MASAPSPPEFSHDQLVQLAARWLVNQRHCGAVLTEMRYLGGETADAIGWCGGYSHLVECKASRSDFLADAKKYFRRRPAAGMGNFRYYLCPAGLIQPPELPAKWGLIWVDAKGRAKLQVGPTGNIWSAQEQFLFAEKNVEAEQALLVSALRRLQGR